MRCPAIRRTFARILLCYVVSCCTAQCSDSFTTETVVQTLTTTRYTTTTPPSSSVEDFVSSTTIIEEIVVSTTEIIVTETDQISVSTSTTSSPDMTVTVTEKVTTSTTPTKPTKPTPPTPPTKPTTNKPSTNSSTTSPVASGSASYSGIDFRHAVLNSTNYYRSQHLAQNVTWNNTLASFAQSWAEKCLWDGSGGPYGENLAEGFVTSPLAVDAWGNEGQHYDYARPRFTESTGHFTQLVWLATTAIGCGAANCSSDASHGANGWYLVCEYWPPGNVAGEYAANVKFGSVGKSGSLSQIFSAAPTMHGGWTTLLVAMLVAGSLVAHVG